jgi:hypothetical protein
MFLAVRIATGVTKHFPVRVAEWQNGAILFGIGLWLCNPYLLTFHSPSYAILLEWAREGWWGIFCTVIGGSRLVALIVNGTLRPNSRTPYVRGAMAFLACLVWALLGLGIAFTPNPGLGVIIYPIMFVTDTWNVWRAMRDSNLAAQSRLDHARDA